MSKLERFKKKDCNVSISSKTNQPRKIPLSSKKWIEKIPLSRGQVADLGVAFFQTESPRDSNQVEDLGVVINTKTPKKTKNINPESLSEFGRMNYNPKLNSRSKAMSSEMTKSEKHIWFNLLSKRQLSGYKFTKQKIIYNYILDFYCSELLLAVEIDGDTHDLEYDKVRDEYVAGIGITTLRFRNQDVFQNLEGVRARILEVIKSKKLPLDTTRKPID